MNTYEVIVATKCLGEYHMGTEYMIKVPDTDTTPKDWLSIIKANYPDTVHDKTYYDITEHEDEYNMAENFFKNNPSICEFVVSSRLIKE